MKMLFNALRRQTRNPRYFRSGAFGVLAPKPILNRLLVGPSVTDAMNTLPTNMRRLVLGADSEVSISDLDKLEEHLTSIHEPASCEGTSTLKIEPLFSCSSLFLSRSGLPYVFKLRSKDQPTIRSCRDNGRASAFAPFLQIYLE
jgi:hypothetical protein